MQAHASLSPGQKTTERETVFGGKTDTLTIPSSPLAATGGGIRLTPLQSILVVSVESSPPTHSTPLGLN